VNDLRQRLIDVWKEWNKALLIKPLMSGADFSVHVFRPKEDTLNIQ